MPSLHAVPLGGGDPRVVVAPVAHSPRGIVAWRGGALVVLEGALTLLDDSGLELRAFSPRGGTSSLDFAYDPHGDRVCWSGFAPEKSGVFCTPRILGPVQRVHPSASLLGVQDGRFLLSEDHDLFLIDGTRVRIEPRPRQVWSWAPWRSKSGRICGQHILKPADNVIACLRPDESALEIAVRGRISDFETAPDALFYITPRGIRRHGLGPRTR